MASPEFDGPEVASFGKEDGHAVTVIGKMLVGFFFYSFLVMLAVALWTMSRGGQVDPNASHGRRMPKRRKNKAATRSQPNVAVRPADRN